MPVPSSWPTGAPYEDGEAVTGELVLGDLAWHEFFRSPELRNLVTKGLENNRDLREAALNIEAARAQYRVQRSAILPTIHAGVAGTAQRVPGSMSPSGEATTSHQYSAEVATTAFELDFFGRLRSLNEEALERYFATEEAAHSVQIALIAEIANAYLTLLADRQQLLLSEQTFVAQQDSYNLAERRFESGVGSMLDLRQAQTLLETARVDRIAFTRLVAQDRNALALLVGAPVADEELGQTFVDASVFVANLPPGLPSDLLLNRPDIRQAEHNLRAANANIGAARAAFFPAISLTASGGTAAAELSGLFAVGSGAWSFIPQITLPIFTAGRNVANLDLAHVRRNIAVVQYEKAIQIAFREVADALAGRGTLDEELSAQQALVDATRKTYELARVRYEKGVDSYLSVLDARRSLYAAEQQLILIQLDRLNNLVALYKSLGGGMAIQN